MSNATNPLVTFALFAYNQEAYVREAVEGAFAQTYEPLEIILSDDCSTDRTFEIMKQMAADYRGPHRVLARRNEINLQTALHVQSVAAIMSGELKVVAAGDDISRPDRVLRLTRSWVEQGRVPVVLHSHAMLVYENGETMSQIAKSRVKDDATVGIDWFVLHQRNPSLAPTAAYARRLFDGFPTLIGGSVIEDGPMVMRGMLSGTFACVPEPLVMQRKLLETAGTGYHCRNLARWNRFVRSKIVSAFNKLQDIPFGSVSPAQALLLERRTVRDIRNLSRCVFQEATSRTVLGRAWIFVMLVLHYPATYGLRGRIGFALAFAGFRSPRK